MKYDSVEIRKDQSRSIFIGLSKKPGVNECAHHCAINLMSHMTKLINLIITNAVCSRIKSESEEEQCGCIPDVSLRKLIFMIRIVSNEMQKDQHLCF